LQPQDKKIILRIFIEKTIMKIWLNILYVIMGIATILCGLYTLKPSEHIPIFLTIIIFIWGITYLLFGLNFLKINKYSNISLIIFLIAALVALYSGTHQELGLILIDYVIAFPISLIFLGISYNVATKKSSDKNNIILK